ENAKLYLKENPEVALDIENQIRAKHNLPLAKAPNLKVAVKESAKETAKETIKAAKEATK
ncbi:MAG: recombinase RecA, partial [Clostridium sp.]